MVMTRRDLIRRILNSRVYQLSSKSSGSNSRDDKYFSHAYSRLLKAEQLLDAIGHATGVRERFAGLPRETRATSLPSPDFGNDFLKLFGQPARNTVCDCERTRGPKMSQALELINGTQIEKKLRDGRSRLSVYFDNVPARVAAAGKPPTDGLVASVKSVEDEKIIAIRQFVLTNGERVVVLTEIGSEGQQKDVQSLTASNRNF